MPVKMIAVIISMCVSPVTDYKNATEAFLCSAESVTEIRWVPIPVQRPRFKKLASASSDIPGWVRRLPNRCGSERVVWVHTKGRRPPYHYDCIKLGKRR